MSKNNELTFKEAFVSNLENFFRTKKIVIWSVLFIIAALVVFFIVWNSALKSIVEKSTLMVEAVQETYADWMAEENETAKEKLAETLLNELADVIEAYPDTYATQRALSIRAKYYIQNKDWEKAAKDYTDLATSFPDSFLAEEGLLNAASCQEELQNYAAAISLHTEFQKKYSQSYKMSYSIFSLGRLYELTEAYTQAAETYRILEEDYVTSGWTKLAQNRLIYISINGLEK